MVSAYTVHILQFSYFLSHPPFGVCFHHMTFMTTAQIASEPIKVKQPTNQSNQCIRAEAEQHMGTFPRSVPSNKHVIDLPVRPVAREQNARVSKPRRLAYELRCTACRCVRQSKKKQKKTTTSDNNNNKRVKVITTTYVHREVSHDICNTDMYNSTVRTVH